MPFDISNLNPGKRFFLPDSKKEWVELRLLPDSKNKEFMKQSGIKMRSKPVFNKKTKRMDQIIDQDDFLDFDKQDAYAKLKYLYQIVNWKIFDVKGQEIPCTDEFKWQMMTECPPFATFVNESLRDMGEVQPDAVEDDD